ncbi:Hypothetical predicted protein [Lecanosticta acicola]|uniref:Nucleoporin NUP53 n=1 Tax=Lecanosticta acicola TaxID=111012 RepID=A0AAI9EBL6_9PEZI|nr:Hypothetical predicted protein [Lecanosticta acicola]
MYGSLPNNRHPRGMQIHAVPEAERALDDNGRRLPWAYDYLAPSGTNENGERPRIEKGPFGRSMRRSRSGLSRSRSKTAEPRREEDKIRADNIAAEDAIFGSLRKVGTKDSGESKREVMAEVDANTVTAQPTLKAQSAAETDSEPTEVLLYGFGDDMQWAAIDFYERVSNGVILEDYERQPPGSRYDISRTLGRQQAQRSLSRAAMRKKNRYAGGAHWIKITFDSSQAAELAIARAPHIVRGFLVYAEIYQGRGPLKDEPIYATQAGVQITSSSLPPSFSTNTLIGGSPEGSPSSATASSATATAPGSRRRPSNQGNQNSPTSSTSTMQGGVPAHALGPSAAAQVTGFQPQPQAIGGRLQARPAGGRIQGATRAVVLPAEMALAPKQPKLSWSSWIGASEIIGSAVPRKEDGTFDWDRASLYWKLFWWIDQVMGTDLCGLRADD